MFYSIKDKSKFGQLLVFALQRLLTIMIAQNVYIASFLTAAGYGIHSISTLPGSPQGAYTSINY